MSEIRRCGRPKTNGKPCMRRGGPCSEHTTTEERQATIAWAMAESNRQRDAEGAWVGSTTTGRPTFIEAEALDRQGIPVCHVWKVPTGPVPNHLSAATALRLWQAGACAMCSASRGRLLVDHCHRTGLVRGLLCASCNTAEAHSEAAAFRAYRKNPPAAMLRIEEQYGAPWDCFGST